MDRADHDHLGADFRGDDFRQRAAELVFAAVSFGRCRSRVFSRAITFYLATWFPAEYRARILAWFFVAIPATSVIGGPISGLLLGMNGVAGLAGWKWLFILEGLPTVLLGIAMLWILADRPEEAAGLPRKSGASSASVSAPSAAKKRCSGCGRRCKDVRVLILAGVQFGFTVGSYGAVIWLPQIIQAGHLSNLRGGLCDRRMLRAGLGGNDRLGRPRRSGADEKSAI